MWVKNQQLKYDEVQNAHVIQKMGAGVDDEGTVTRSGWYIIPIGTEVLSCSCLHAWAH